MKEDRCGLALQANEIEAENETEGTGPCGPETH